MNWELRMWINLEHLPRISISDCIIYLLTFDKEIKLQVIKNVACKKIFSKQARVRKNYFSITVYH